MNKKIQALACAAILALGGFNLCESLSSDNASELKLDDVEAAATTELGSRSNSLGTYPLYTGTDWIYVMQDYYGGLYTYMYRCDLVTSSNPSNCALGKYCFKYSGEVRIACGYTLSVEEFTRDFPDKCPF